MPTAFGFRPHENYTNRNVLRSGFPVCVIATYNPVGDFKPISFGAEIEGMRYRHNVTVKSFKESHGVYTFDCEYTDLGLIKAVRLVFDVAALLWTIG